MRSGAPPFATYVGDRRCLPPGALAEPFVGIAGNVP